MTNIERFEMEIAKIRREGASSLLNYCRTSDFYTAPSSTKFHLSVEGGLLQHSLNVYDALKAMLKDNENGSYSYMVVGKPVATISEETLIIITLLHDLCKTHFYGTEQRNKKIDGQWKVVDVYNVQDEFPYGHGEKSVMMIESCFKLSMEERMAIRWHMGFPEGYSEKQTFGLAVEKYPIIWALHNADMMASKFMETETGNRPEFLQ